MRIAMFDTKDYDRESFEKYNHQNDIEITYFDTKLSMNTAMLTKGYDGVCIFVNDDGSKEVIDTLYQNGVKFILLRCAGYNNVDVKACYGKIHVYRVPAYSPYAVAEHAMALLLTSIRRIHKAYNRTRDFNFNISGFTGFDLHGKTVGVIGTGKIGRIFIDICNGFGMNVLAYDKFPNPEVKAKYVSLDELYQQSDIISFHCPLLEDTFHMFNKETLSKVKKGVTIVNTSRGALIDSQALLDGLKDRIIGAACLDVYEEENDIFFNDFSGHIVNDDVLARLISLPNVLMTSHQAFLTRDALDNIADTTIKNALMYMNKESNDNELCYHCPNIENCKKKRKKMCF